MEKLVPLQNRFYCAWILRCRFNPEDISHGKSWNSFRKIHRPTPKTQTTLFQWDSMFIQYKSNSTEAVYKPRHRTPPSFTVYWIIYTIYRWKYWLASSTYVYKNSNLKNSQTSSSIIFTHPSSPSQLKFFPPFRIFQAVTVCDFTAKAILSKDRV